MPIPSGYSRNVIYGHLAGGEIFNMSLWVNEAPSDQGAAQSQATALANKFAASCTTPPTGIAPTSLMGSDSGYDGVRVYSYTDTSGKAKYIADASVGKNGTATAANYLPDQCALVVRLNTAVAGRSATGRIYVPLTRYNVQAGGQLDVSQTGPIAAWWAQLLHDWNTLCSPGHVGVLSQKNGTYQSATSVVVDSRVDIQRRRANRQAPLFKSSSPVT